MSAGKPLVVFWSKAAVASAGTRLLDLQEKLVEEAREIVSQARHQFLHAIPGEGKEFCYTCTGNESPNEWEIFVQVGEYQTLSRLADDHAVPHLRGKTVKIPKAIEDTNNEIFARFDDVDGA